MTNTEILQMLQERLDKVRKYLERAKEQQSYPRNEISQRALDVQLQLLQDEAEFLAGIIERGQQP